MSKPDRDADATSPSGETGNVLRTTNAALPQPLPVYIAYFTAGRRADGTMAIERDVYGRDMLIGDPSNPQRQCAN